MFSKSQPSRNTDLIVINSDSDDDDVHFNRDVMTAISVEEGNVEDNEDALNDLVVDDVISGVTIGDIMEVGDDDEDEDIKPNVAAEDLDRYKAKLIEDDVIVVSSDDDEEGNAPRSNNDSGVGLDSSQIDIIDLIRGTTNKR